MNKAPNVILISIDTLRADHLSCYGYNRESTPNIDRLASAGLRFSNAISTAVWTPPAHASMLTGVNPTQHGVLHQNKLRPNIQTIGEHLQKQGYQTAGFVNNSQVGELVGLDRGHTDFFEVWKGYSKHQVYQKAKLKIKTASGYADHGAAATNKLVYKWLNRQWQTDNPFYLFIHYIDAHNPLRAPRPFRFKYLSAELRKRVDMNKIWRVAENPLICLTDDLELSQSEIEALTCLYDEEIAYVDCKIGQLTSWLARQGILNNTLLIITADHGEHLGERQMYSHVASLYQPIVHIPLIIHFPPGGNNGEVRDFPVQHIDILPTILDACKLKKNADNTTPGQSLLSADSETTASRYLFAEWEGRVPYFVRDRLAKRNNDRAIEQMTNKKWLCRNGDHKLIMDASGGSELYDLKNDPTETHEIGDREPETLARMTKALSDYRNNATDESSESYDYSEGAVKEHLKALGYL